MKSDPISNGIDHDKLETTIATGVIAMSFETGPFEKILLLSSAEIECSDQRDGCNRNDYDDNASSCEHPARLL